MDGINNDDGFDNVSAHDGKWKIYLDQMDSCAGHSNDCGVGGANTNSGDDANYGHGEKKVDYGNDLDFGGGGDSNDDGIVDVDNIESNICNDASLQYGKCKVGYSEDTASVNNDSNVDGSLVMMVILILMMMMVEMVMIMVLVNIVSDDDGGCCNSIKIVFKNKQIDLAKFSLLVFVRLRESLKYNFLFNIIMLFIQSPSFFMKYVCGRFLHSPSSILFVS